MGRWVFSAILYFPITMVNRWVEKNGCSKFNLQPSMVNTWVDGYGRSEFNLQQAMVNTWVDGYGCPELHSNTKTPAVSIGTSVYPPIGTSVHSHIGTSFGC